MSVVIVTDVLPTIQKTLRHLREQTIADRLEIMIVAKRGADIDLDDQSLGGFAATRVVEVEEVSSLSWARAPGIEAATAPIVTLAESHCYPEAGWAEALLAAHAGPWAAVGPAVYNANPESAVSWVNLLIDYGPWLGPTEGGEIDDLPGHNSSYKRAVLLAYGRRLGLMLEAETIMHVDLRARGFRLYQEPKARVKHLNVTDRSSWLGERFQTGRRFAAARAHEWSLPRRAVYAGGSPLIPLVRLPRMMRHARRTGDPGRVLGGNLPLLAAALAASAAGELVGYATGSGDSMFALSRIEMHKELHVSERERLAQLA